MTKKEIRAETEAEKPLFIEEQEKKGQRSEGKIYSQN